MYVTDSFTRTVVTINDNGFYTKSVHFGWLKETDETVQRNYPRSKVQLAMQNKGHIVHFKDSQAIFPAQYYQRHYPPYENGCVWLATCQLMFSLNKDLANRIIQEYIRCPGKYEFIRIFESKRSVEKSLYEYIKSIDGCEYRIVHVEPTANVHLTDYVLNHRTARLSLIHI